MKESVRRHTKTLAGESIFIIVVLIAASIAGGCASSPRFTRDRSAGSSSHAAGDDAKSLKTMTGIASYYADDFNGKKTANGETYDMYKMTAAHRSLPFNTKVRVTNLDNKRSIIVRINDRGPFKLERIIDLSLAAATQLGMKGTGTANVKLEVVEWGDDEYAK
ncbi:MAG TPA: septal ring lytic transglycosylase RlpA family protein [Bacteroidota bacterium]|nr:septal ring lytic transglycosylase RlpA family protein [Bacteroidota bacterium]